MENVEKKSPGRPPRKSKSPSLIARAFQENRENTTASAEELTEIINDAAPIERPPMRPSMRDEDPRTAAARRAAQIRGHLGDEIVDGVNDEFAAPPAPPGWTYQWKAKSVMGQEKTAEMINHYRAGWEHVPTDRHPEMMPNAQNIANIERKGQVLMQIPTEILKDYYARDERKAKGQVEMKKQQLTQAPQGHFERSQRETKLNKSYVPMQVPNE